MWWLLEQKRILGENKRELSMDLVIIPYHIGSFLVTNVLYQHKTLLIREAAEVYGNFLSHLCDLSTHIKLF